MDGLAALARRADAQGQVVGSLNLAQTALIALQLLPCPAEPAQAEAWFSRLQWQHQGYRWSKLAPGPAPLVRSQVLNFGGYAGSLRLSTELLVETSGKWYDQGLVTNQFWSATWFALEQLRQALRLHYALSQEEPVPAGEARRQAGTGLQYVLDHYHQAQRMLAAMVRRNLQPGKQTSLWVQCMLDEGATSLEHSQIGHDLQWCRAVQESLRAHGYTKPTLDLLGELLAALEPRRGAAEA
jgi:hypothetical protein